MKRVAESQLTKDAGENDEEDQEVGTGFRKAEPSVLSERPMRGLPKRGISASVAPSKSPDGVNGSTSESPRFNAFSGFGTPGTTHAFTFTPPSQTSKAPLQPAGVTSTQPPVSSTKGPFLFSSQPNATPPSASPPLTTNTQNKQEAALKYCMTLRGINLSFLDEATKAFQADPFLDIAYMLEKYKSLRLTAQKQFDSSCDTSVIGRDSQLPSSLSVSSTPASKPSPSMPVPPTSFLRFQANAGSTSSSTQSVGGFTPKVDSSTPVGGSSSPFTFTKTTPSLSGASTKPFSAFASAAPTDDRVSGGNLVATFTEPTSSSSNIPLGKTYAFDAFKPEGMNNDSKSTAASDSISGKDEKPPEKINKPSFPFKPSTSTAPLTPGLSSFLNSSKSAEVTAGTSTPPSNKDASSNASPSSPSVFGFGASKSVGSSSPFGSFGKGSIGNPVGFAFGSPASTPGAAEPSDAVAPQKDSNPSVDEGVTQGSLPAPTDPAHDPSPAPSQGSAYDADGPGEEDETTLHESKARAYKLTPTGDKKGWVSIGIGQLKLKAHVDLAKRRILMRNSNTGQVILNFSLFSGFQITTDDKSISFRVPGEDDAAAVYRLKVSNEAEAQSWQEAIQKEVDKLVPSSDS